MPKASVAHPSEIDIPWIEQTLAVLCGGTGSMRPRAVYAESASVFCPDRDWIWMKDAQRGEFAVAFDGYRRNDCTYYALMLRFANVAPAGICITGGFSGSQPPQEHRFDLYQAPCMTAAGISGAAYRGSVFYAEGVSSGEGRGSDVSAIFGLAGSGCRLCFQAEARNGKSFESGMYDLADLRLSLRGSLGGDDQSFTAIVTASYDRLEGGFAATIEEIYMEKPSAQDAAVTISLGEIEIAWEDLSRIRPGSIVALPPLAEVGACILLQGEKWASGQLTLRDDKLFFQVGHFTAMEQLKNHAAQETSASGPRLLDELIAGHDPGGKK